MDRLYLEDRNAATPDEDDESNKIIQQKGNDHEINFLHKLKSDGRDICEIDVEANNAFALTTSALKSGREVIYQGVLVKPPFEGRSDFLIRTNQPSALGNYSYEVWDTKLSRKAKPYFIVQLCCYAEMLNEIQELMPEKIGIILGDGRLKSFSTESFVNFYRALKERFLQTQNVFDKNRPPYFIVPNNLSRWRSHAEKILKERDDLLQVANITQSQIRKLHKAGITTGESLATLKAETIKGLDSKVLSTLKRQARLQKESCGLPKPKYEVITVDPNTRKGLALLPPPSESDIFFDMEGYPHTEGGLEYLFGISYGKNGQPAFIDWWAHDRQEEKLAFESFIDWTYERWRTDPSMHIYHYAPYEVSAVRRLAGRHGTRENTVDELLRNEVFVDLYRIVRQGLCVGEDSYSIKKIEHLYLDARVSAVSKATESIVYYERWLEQQDGKDWQSSKLLLDIRNYNEMDCISTMKLAQWLRAIQQEQLISYMPKKSVVDPDSDDSEQIQQVIKANPSEWLAMELLSEIPLDRSADPESWRIQELLAHLLNFYRREEKPIWWKRFDRQAMTEEQLINDPDCLAGLERTSTPEIKIKNSKGYEYRFDPDQDHKIGVGESFRFLHDLLQTGVVHSLDSDKGLLVLKLGPSKQAPPNSIHIMPEEGVNNTVLKDAVLRIVTAWRNKKILPQAVDDLLRRKHPRIKELNAGQTIISSPDQVVTDAINAIKKLDSSYLCIQGPPGSGKTNLAAYAIIDLIQNGKKVGITSNSHKAIENLLRRVCKLTAENNIPFIGAKVSNDNKKQNQTTEQSSIVHIGKEELFSPSQPDYQVIGATAWTFASQKASGKFDYLFVDEAGQVSLAHMLAMSESAKNIVLFGDQMQLDQPIAGSHPEESGKSILSYLLGDSATIPPEQGVFLPFSHRMHPDLCSVVSKAVYEGKLQSSANTKNHQLIFDQSKPSSLSKNAGLLYIPVEHDGNSQASPEEAELIRIIVQELLHCQIFRQDNDGTRNMEPSDILIVAPYNKQRRLLQSLIPQIEIGTVDKFQGRQAPVVILSMCASDMESSPRGIEFLLSKNRLNVAISRAQALAIVVGNPRLINTTCHTIEQMELLDFFCRIVASGSVKPQTIEQKTVSIIK